MTLAVGSIWFVLVLAWFGRRPPVPARVARLAPDRAPIMLPRPLQRWLPALAAASATAFVFPLAAPAVFAGAWATPVVRARRRDARERDEVLRTLPDLVDLLTLTVGAGMTVPLALAAVAHRHVGPIALELQRVVDDMTRGRRCADALDDAAVRLGPDVRPVLAALASADRYGAPLGDALIRIGADVRADRRRRAEAAARRVPVRLLFPLVLCVLPAFALLTVAPLLASALRSLRL